jgi:hypothetical protein
MSRLLSTDTLIIAANGEKVNQNSVFGRDYLCCRPMDRLLLRKKDVMADDSYILHKNIAFSIDERHFSWYTSENHPRKGLFSCLSN